MTCADKVQLPLNSPIKTDIKIPGDVFGLEEFNYSDNMAEKTTRKSTVIAVS